MWFFSRVPSVTWKEVDKTKDIIDVREDDEWKEGHVKGLIHIPLQNIGYYEPKDKEEPVYIVCRSGNRSSQAARFLKSKGINAINVKGGMLEYKGELGKIVR